MIAPADMPACREAIRHGSLSFHAASRLLPARVRDPALALYAFCRLADDAVDEGADKRQAVLRLRDRLDLVYRGTTADRAADRAFAAVVAGHEMPRTLPEALLEGLAWDALGRRHATLSELRDYSARVASAVGVMMCVLMGVRDEDALARACDLGVAMPLTNIARDVGEDARAGRIYLPGDWLAAAGIDGAAFRGARRWWTSPYVTWCGGCWQRRSGSMSGPRRGSRHCGFRRGRGSARRATSVPRSAARCGATAAIR